MRVNQVRQDPQPNQGHVEIKVPATQAEQVADDVALLAAEYFPKKVRDEEYGYDDFNTSVLVNIRRRRKNGTCNTSGASRGCIRFRIRG
jgi:hypothetical protein